MGKKLDITGETYGYARPSGIPVSNIMEVIFGNLSVLYVVKDLKQKLEM